MKKVKRRTLKEIHDSPPPVRRRSKKYKPKPEPNETVKFLKNFVSKTGKLLPRRKTRLSSKEHKQVVNIIKRARGANLFPFVISDV